MVIKFINCDGLLCFGDGVDGLFLLRQYTEKNNIIIYKQKIYYMYIYIEIEKVRHFRKSPS